MISALYRAPADDTNKETGGMRDARDDTRTLGGKRRSSRHKVFSVRCRLQFAAQARQQLTKRGAIFAQQRRLDLQINWPRPQVQRISRLSATKIKRRKPRPLRLGQRLLEHLLD